MLQKTEGIVLHSLRYSDTALIVNLYTEQLGRLALRIPVSAPHSSRSRRGAVRSVLFQPLSILEMELDVRPGATIYKIKEAKAVCPFASIPYDPVKSAITLFLAEFLYRAVREETGNRALYAYLRHSIVWLDTCRDSVANYHLVFLMRLSRFLGLTPNLDDYRTGDYFDLQGACFTSVRPSAHPFFLHPDEAARLSLLMRMNYDTMHLFRFSRAERNRCLVIINDFYRLHLPDFPVLKSIEVLKELFD
ncbi:MAG: DNA repair protein RecO [Prevotellaceae bacterium]|jgi:DNA repair protein RecO (recombination protein O)|nr:DNA repair protein RecO [Prevotellaceae bacterium]